MKFFVYLDSTQSTGTRPSSSLFNLNQPIVSMMQMKVKSFTFGNTLHNVVSPYNTLVFNSTSLTLPEGYYTFSELIDYINTALMANVLFTANLTVETHAVVLDSENSAVWTIGSNILQITSGMYKTFVLNPYRTYTGNFQSNIFLAQPMAIALTSQALQGSASRFITTADQRITNPFFICPVTDPFGSIQSPQFDLDFTLAFSNNSLNQFDLVLFDPATGRELVEVGHWSLILEIITR